MLTTQRAVAPLRVLLALLLALAVAAQVALLAGTLPDLLARTDDDVPELRCGCSWW